MAFVHGSSTHALVNEVLISSEINGWSMGWNRQMSEVTCVGQTAGQAGSNFIPGLQSGALGLRGPQDSNAAAGLTAEIVAAIGVDNDFTCTCLPDGFAVGKQALFMVGDVTEYAVDASVADAVGMTLTAQPDEAVEMGWVLAAGPGAITALVPYTADALTGTAVDRGTSLSVVSGNPVAYSVGGAAAAVHVTAYSGFTGVVVKIQHSPDNAAWSDLATFATITATGRQKINVAKGTTVNRYLRASVDVTGSGSVTLLVAVAPR